MCPPHLSPETLMIVIFLVVVLFSFKFLLRGRAVPGGHDCGRLQFCKALYGETAAMIIAGALSSLQWAALQLKQAQVPEPELPRMDTTSAPSFLKREKPFAFGFLLSWLCQLISPFACTGEQWRVTHGEKGGLQMHDVRLSSWHALVWTRQVKSWCAEFLQLMLNKQGPHDSICKSIPSARFTRSHPSLFTGRSLPCL